MIEPTVEMIHDIRERIGGSEIAARSAAEAVLAVVERDYDVKRKLCGNRGFAGASGCWRELGHEGNHLWSRETAS